VLANFRVCFLTAFEAAPQDLLLSSMIPHRRPLALGERPKKMALSPLGPTSAEQCIGRPPKRAIHELAKRGRPVKITPA
jgi:hypothetical protein